MPETDHDPSTVLVDRALEELCRGGMVLVVDDEDRENEGDLVMAAEHATSDALAFMIRHTSGVLYVGIDGARVDELALPPMVARGDDPRETAFTVSVDLKEGTTTGISAADRARTIRALADPSTRPEDLSRPGHVFPLRARDGGVLQRTGHTESAVDLCRLAGLAPAGVLAEVANDDGTMARRPDLERFAQRHGLVSITVADLVRHRLRTEALVVREAVGRVPTRHGEFDAVAYRSVIDGVEHMALVRGPVTARPDPLVRVHSECLTGDVFGSLRCDCGDQLDAALAQISAAGCGAIVYLRGHEGRGIGLSHKLRAYKLQDEGLDTVEANTALGLPVDARDYAVGSHILRDLGVGSLRLMTNNPAKQAGLADYGVAISGREPLVVAVTTENVRYLTAKHTRMDHDLGRAVATPAAPALSVFQAQEVG
ncbi:3,4-dihydroxy 2-butanone 4-phosphate synthase/GTP cyclohydrolase II [Pseudonocardia sediminis]|uniref:Riboflavin biosynthesis protein RibBA n=1 Tax=Pseudonocardia sediminis TaxID=1397368 RepID=A0A4Q7V408_PSEST|nr:bifunctional 3,4-dihydroxy-2-butanone-4-phosphate synthase/GTP cyclohydrolase II [Pseudonocardia sediminis]RZT87329.1 3,4-dihydroxy 2-butanone 4-phosphate synthase/GTP cyclohydrolase II [Pseudonocardia sediminis]